MNLEIADPDVVERVSKHIRSGRFQNADDLIGQALDALDGEPIPSPAVVRRMGIEELFAPLRGLNLDFSRNPSTGRTDEV